MGFKILDIHVTDRFDCPGSIMTQYMPVAVKQLVDRMDSPIGRLSLFLSDIGDSPFLKPAEFGFVPSWLNEHFLYDREHFVKMLAEAIHLYLDKLLMGIHGDRGTQLANLILQLFGCFLTGALHHES
jgi:hypothetical protein